MATHLSDTPTNPPSLPVALTRARDGRWLAGVCAGLARDRDLPLRQVRAAFVLAAIVGGVGVLAYLACWLIIPADTDDETGAAGTRGIVILAQGCAACVGLATLAAAGAAATIFGFGWAVLAIAAAVLVGALVSWPRVGVAWALLPIVALVLPALAMTIGGVKLAAESRDAAIAPQSVADLPTGGYRSGLGSLLVDLRHTAFPATGNVTLRIDAGIRRTIVALPANRCVYVDVHYDVVPFAARLASILRGRGAPFSGVTLFGDVHGSRSGEAGNVPSPTPSPSPSPTPTGSPILTIDFHSAGGSLYARDYPDDVDPQFEPDWPGYPVTLEPRPDITGTPPAGARRLIDGWLLRRRVQSASAAALDRLIPGPCGTAAGQPPAGLATGAATNERYFPQYVPVGSSFATVSQPPQSASQATGGVPRPPKVPVAPAAPVAGSPASAGTAAPTGGSKVSAAAPVAGSARSGAAAVGATRKTARRTASTRPTASRARRGRR
ncbi:MAG TPA: PspC domain-containing protein [Solirubrobacteraceae bacterium]|jgi:phage shock protein PspC (stress-responsive transcriptional regulator)|nr:PspC domain-containing protein [Solirubrobacteraceae bacterium]